MSSDLCLVSLHDISREGLHRILSSDGFNILVSCRKVEKIIEARVDCDFSVVIDLQDRDVQMKAIEEIGAAYPLAKIAVLVEQFDMSSMIECFDAGVDGYIVKSMSSQPLITALRLVTLGEKVLPSELANVLSQHNFEHPIGGGDLEHEMEDANLSSRERDVLCCLMAGYSNKVIARELDVCEATVKVHVKAILRKLDVSNRTQAAMWASTRGFSHYHVASQQRTPLPSA
ncbi:response regulator transcription factor [Altererythrobacter arenosus]|uniref:Response regulator transcription factor n=1 Tax=Altererythrobacter arenosus TaxID=3032592 RepID=A0ABY8FVB4_9SPHN|nr:response regulator transcription factor [Altererythrobacter sp. CAU 1644]WFL75964.1 response regulator transcription factor [Altererythrobacter sp. CAU 1644]